MSVSVNHNPMRSEIETKSKLTKLLTNHRLEETPNYLSFIQDDRQRIMETERRLVLSGVITDSEATEEPTHSFVSNVSSVSPGAGARRHTTRRHRRKLPEIPKHKKRMKTNEGTYMK